MRLVFSLPARECTRSLVVNQTVVLLQKTRANLGVLAGIFLLASEIRQNQKLLELENSRFLDSASLEVSRYTVMRELRIGDKEIAQLG